MYLEPTDIRPRSLLDWEWPGAAQVLAGIGATLVVHVGIPLAVTAVVGLFAVAGISILDELTAPPEPPPIVENVVQARFVQLGEVLDPNQLPDRLVPILRTDPVDPRPAPSLERNPPPPAERAPERRQRDSVEDAIRRLSEDAQIFAERAEARLREGDPEGVEGGTERHGTEGDLYRGRLWAFFRRGWSVPTTIPDAVVERLTTVVVIDVGADTRIEGFRVVRSSGNPDFDESVVAQMTRIRTNEGNIPPPPEEVAAQYLGREVTLNFRGRDARR
jgi:outer membrane biosynthesis protein TonB